MPLYLKDKMVSGVSLGVPGKSAYDAVLETNPELGLTEEEFNERLINAVNAQPFFSVGAYFKDLDNVGVEDGLPLNSICWVDRDKGTTNMPEGNFIYGICVTESTNDAVGNEIMQTIYAYSASNKSKVYKRMKVTSNSKWYDWYEVLTSETFTDLVTLEAIGAAPEGLVNGHYTASTNDGIMSIIDNVLTNMDDTTCKYITIAVTGTNTDLLSPYGSTTWLLFIYKNSASAAFVIAMNYGNPNATKSFYQRYNQKINNVWGGWTDAPANLTPAAIGAAKASHEHAAGDITSGTLPVARGGTGVTANPSMLTNLASTTAASMFTTSPRPGVTGTLPVANGGTGATTFTSGRALIGAGTGAVTTRAITNSTAATTAISANTNLVTMNTLRYALNRTTGPASADTNYGTAMMRAIKADTTDITAGSAALTSGMIYLVYE